VASVQTAPPAAPGPPPDAPKEKLSTRKQTGAWTPKWYWPTFAAPATIWLAIFFLIPLYVILSVAFGTSDPIFGSPVPVYEPWWWSGNAMKKVIGRFFGGAPFWRPALLRTFAFVFAASFICVVLGFAVAYYVARYGGKWKTLYLVLLVSPFWISYLMRIFAWQSLLQPDGYINKVLSWTHISTTPIEWLSGKPITVILALVYGYIPYMILPIYGGIDRMNVSLLEAGRDLGASPSKTFWRVTVPLSKQAVLAGTVIVALPMFGDYYTNDLVGTSKTSMYGNLINNAYSAPGQGPRIGSLVLILVVILLIPMMYYLRSTKRASEGLS
jgi:ABC-type spermidine/putrescine transport system permease subunit I